jgi:hypothetical protein
MPERITRFVHHVDHIIPPKHGGTSDMDNLAWACFQCNTHKQRDFASFDPNTKVVTLLYNPRTQNWDEHFEVVGLEIIGRSPVGRVTVIVLDMNHPLQIEMRQELATAGLW